MGIDAVQRKQIARRDRKSRPCAVLDAVRKSAAAKKVTARPPRARCTLYGDDASAAMIVPTPSFDGHPAG